MVVRLAGGSAEMAEQVRTGALDLAFVGLDGNGAQGVMLTALSREPMALICHREHPLAGEQQVRVADLADAVFADVPPSWGTRIALESALVSAGITREVRYEVNDMATVAEFVEQDLAVAVMPPSYVPAHPDVRIVPIADGPAFVVSLATPTGRAVSGASAALARIITNIHD